MVLPPRTTTLVAPSASRTPGSTPGGTPTCTARAGARDSPGTAGGWRPRGCGRRPGRGAAPELDPAAPATEPQPATGSGGGAAGRRCWWRSTCRSWWRPPGRWRGAGNRSATTGSCWSGPGRGDLPPPAARHLDLGFHRRQPAAQQPWAAVLRRHRPHHPPAGPVGRARGGRDAGQHGGVVAGGGGGPADRRGRDGHPDHGGRGGRRGRAQFALGSELLFDVWQPNALVLPFFGFLVVATVLATGDVVMAPWVAGLGQPPGADAPQPRRDRGGRDAGRRGARGGQPAPPGRAAPAAAARAVDRPRSWCWPGSNP